MTRLFLASIAVVSALAVVPYAGKAQKETPKKGALPKSNQVYVKIILPGDPAKRDKDRPVVESWITEYLKKRGQTKFAAATAWVPIAFTGEKFEDPTDVWDGRLDGRTWGCPVEGRIVERADGRIKVLFDGWSPGGAEVTVSLKDEPGSREIAAVERAKTDDGMPYVAVLIGPPPEKAAIPAKKGELAALEQKLVGTWIGTGPCDGRMVFQADGTYHVTDWTVGQIYGTGTWKIQWSELPPTLILSHPRLFIELGLDPKKPTKVSLVTLNDKALNFGYPEQGSPAGRHKRGTESDGMRIRLTILDEGVQRYLGTNRKLPPNLKALVDEKILWPESLVDPWGKEFQYDITGKKTKNKEVPDIWTVTPDKNIIGNFDWSKWDK